MSKLTPKLIVQLTSAMMSRLILPFSLFAMLAFAGLFFKGFRQKKVASHTLPPLGERQYLLPNDRRFDGVVIQGLNQRKGTRYMRDPDQLKLADSTGPESSVGRAAPAVPAMPLIPRGIAKSAELRFRKVKVSGRATHPRLEFNLDALPIERADEPMNQDFYPRVFAPAQDYSF